MDFLRRIKTEKEIYSAEQPKITKVKMTKGLITGGWIYFPAGPAEKLHVVVLRGKHQIFPIDAGNDYALDDCIMPLSGGLYLWESPFQLSIHTWNNSTEYDHTLSICVFLDPEKALTEKSRGWFHNIFSNGKSKE